MKRFLFHIRHGWLGERRLRLEISEEEILADLSYGRDDDEAIGRAVSLPEADEPILMN